MDYGAIAIFKYCLSYLIANYQKWTASWLDYATLTGSSQPEPVLLFLFLITTTEATESFNPFNILVLYKF